MISKIRTTYFLVYVSIFSTFIRTNTHLIRFYPTFFQNQDIEPIQEKFKTSHGGVSISDKHDLSKTDKISLKKKRNVNYKRVENDT